jgi:hypothetical protein
MSGNRVTLLIGNGPNRLAESAVSWNEVLYQLLVYAPKKIRRQSANKPLPLLFEEIALRLESTGKGDVGVLKRHVASLLNHLTPNSVHSRIMGLGLSDILTTNYDYSLERGSVNSGNSEDLNAQFVHESKFSLFRSRSVGTTRVWHIHGELDAPRSITLGYDHYASYLGRLQRYVSGQGDDGHTSPFLKGDDSFDDSGHTYSWVDVFLRNDVHILGLALGFEEIDLWWLLTAKERLRHRYERRKRESRIGRTFYYHLAIGDEIITDNPKLLLLQGIGVKVERVEIDGDWEFPKAYHRILTDIRSQAHLHKRK